MVTVESCRKRVGDEWMGRLHQPALPATPQDATARPYCVVASTAASVLPPTESTAPPHFSP